MIILIQLIPIDMQIQMDSVFTMEVIICTKTRRGNGVDDPIRVITEVFTKDGELIADYDPHLDKQRCFAGIEPGLLDKPIKFPK